MENFNEKIYDIINENEYSGLTVGNLLKKLGAKSVFDKKNIAIALNELINDGRLIEQKGKNGSKLFLPHKINAVKGRIQGNAKGFGFLISPEREEDVFIPAKKMNGAQHNDIVLVKMLQMSKGNQSSEGEVLAVVERGMKRVVGTFKANEKYGFVTPDDSKFFHDIFIPEDKFNSAQNGQKVVAEITAYPKQAKNPEGKIIEVLGDAGDSGMEVLSIIRAYGLYEEFGNDVLNDAKKVNVPITTKDLAGRKDLRKNLIITVDGDDAKDLDDAISLTADKNGIYHLGVHIADVTHYVYPNGALDKEAYKRGTSVYFPDRVLPMLPRELSNGICSLNEKQDRLTLSVLMDIDGSGTVKKSEIVESVISSSARMTYDVVTKLLEGDEALEEKYKDIKLMLVNMEKLMGILNAKRAERGSIDFEIPESKIILDSMNKVQEISPYPRTVSNRLIEEFMLITNETVAEYMFHNQVPFVYRVHENPAEEKAAVMLAFAQGLGLKFKINKNIGLQPKTVQQILEQAEGKPIFNVINKVMLRSMQKARYLEDNLGHFGLAAKFYCHFTSPIRRYPDLAIHRIIKDFLKNGLRNMPKYETFVADASAQSSDRERKAESAEREVEDLLKTEYMRKHLGEKFDGVISGVTEFGIFVELDNTCEGLIRLENLPEDYYHYNPDSFSLVGKKIVYRLGDKIEIIVAGADTTAKKIEFIPA